MPTPGQQGDMDAINDALSRSGRGMTEDLRNASRQIDAIDSKFRGLSGAIGGAAAGVAGLTAKWVALGAAAGAAAVAVKSIQTAAKFEDMSVAMSRFAGGLDQARARMAEITALAVKTPMTIDAVTSAVTRLGNAGFESRQTVEMVRLIGDAASTSQKGVTDATNHIILALTQIRGKNKLMAQEMNQLAETGLPAWQMLASGMGISVTEAMAKSKAGAIDATTALNALFSSMESQFGGEMSARAATFNGILSNLHDQFILVSKTLGDAMLPALKGLASEGTKWVQEMRAMFEGGTLQASFSAVIENVKGFTHELMENLKTLKSWAEYIASLGGNVGAEKVEGGRNIGNVGKELDFAIEARQRKLEEDADPTKQGVKLLPLARAEVVRAQIADIERRMQLGRAEVEATDENLTPRSREKYQKYVQGRGMFKSEATARQEFRDKVASGEIEVETNRGIADKANKRRNEDLTGMLWPMKQWLAEWDKANPQTKGKVQITGGMPTVGDVWNPLMKKLDEWTKAVDKGGGMPDMGNAKNFGNLMIEKHGLKAKLAEFDAERDKPKPSQFMGISENWKRMQAGAFGAEEANAQRKKMVDRLESIDTNMKGVARALAARVPGMGDIARFAN